LITDVTRIPNSSPLYRPTTGTWRMADRNV
jgi:hypothetical protein